MLESKKASAARLLLLALCTIGLAGCATREYSKPLPTQTATVSVKVSTAESSEWSDGMFGLHRIPSSQVLMSCQSGSIAAVVLLGPLGAAANAVASNAAGERMAGDAKAILQMKIDSQVASSIDLAIASRKLHGKFVRGDAASESTMLIEPAVVLCAVSETDIQPFVILKANLRKSDSTSVWKSRYVSSTGAPRPLSGPGSWTDKGGSDLKSSINQSIDQIVQLMFNDIASPYVRDEDSLVAVEAQFPYIRARSRVVGYKLAETDRYLSFAAKAGDASSWAGVYVVDKTISSNRPARPGEPGVDIVDGNGSKPTTVEASSK